MEQVFLRLVHMSMAAGWLVLAVIALRLALRRAPKRIVCLLWALVALRLVCPVALESPVSLVPRPETIAQAAQARGIPVSPVLPAETEVTGPEASPASAVTALSCVWCAGTAAMLLWALWSDLRLRRRVRVSVPQGEGIRLCDEIDTPFVLGVVRPIIYLPSWLEPVQAGYVLAHEHAHIARRDHWWKPLGWVLLSVYWFQPLLWLGYVLFSRDLELACDECVAGKLDRAGLAAYSEALLRCSRARGAMMLPVAFGETGVKTRVQAILRYRKPAFRLVLLAFTAIFAAGVLFLTDRPAQAVEQPPEISGEQAEEAAPLADNDELREYLGHKADLMQAAKAAPTPTPTPSAAPTPMPQAAAPQTARPAPAQAAAQQSTPRAAAETPKPAASEPTPAPTAAPAAETPSGDIVDSGSFGAPSAPADNGNTQTNSGELQVVHLTP